MDANKMERGEDQLSKHFGDDTKAISIRQTRKGWCVQCFCGCEVVDEFKWFNITDGKNDQFSTSLEESSCLARVCCSQCHEFKMVAKEEGSGEEVLSMFRPWACGPGPCKCCCYQKMEFSQKGKKLGEIEELCFWCVPRMRINDASGKPVYKVHSPTCCFGVCVNCCAEGNCCCGKGCCKVPFHIFPHDQEDTDNGAPHAGKILKLPKSLTVELLSDAEAFDVTFPEDATTVQKAIIAGSAIFINATFFEGQEEN